MERIEILKTYKIYIGGQFPRTESGRYYDPKTAEGKPLANICLSSRKDLRNAVVAARKAFGGWAERAAFNRGQILYRIAEMLEGRRAQFVDELIKQGSTKAAADKEVSEAVDLIVYYCGWADKFQQLFSSVNPVASSHFNFSAQEATGVVGVLAPQNSSLLGLVQAIIPAITGGNTVIALASEKLPLCAVTFAEVINSSDVPGGVVNILTGKESELATQFASHMDINAVLYAGNDDATFYKLKEIGTDNVKRVKRFDAKNTQNPYTILDFQEVKTTWHPIENIGGSTSSY